MTPEHRLLRLTPADDGGFSLLMEIANKLDTLVEDHQATREMIEGHMKGEDHLLGLFKDAFPGGDPLGHCQWHEAEIARIRARKEFWTKMTFELAKWGLIGFVGWAVLQLWHGALQGPAK